MISWKMLEPLINFFFLHPFSFVFILVISFILLQKLSTTKTNLPPSPQRLPIIGNLHQLGSPPHFSLQTLSHRHGPLMLLHFGSLQVFVVSSAEVAQEMFKNHDLTFSDRPKSIIFEKLLYNYKDVASASYGEYWKQMRSICVLHLLSNKKVRSFHDIREEELKFMINKIKQSCSSVNLSELFVKLTNDIVCRAALGRKYSEEEGVSKFKELLGDFLELLGSFNIGDYIPFLAWLNYLNGLDAKTKKVAQELDEFLESVVEERMNLQNKENDSHDVTNDNIEGHKNFVDILLQIQKENLLGSPFERISIKAILLDMFAAGTDTTSTALEWTMTELLRHPKAMEKLQNEVRTVVGDTREIIAEDDVQAMKYLKAVLKETLRIHPPIPLLVPKASTQDVKIKGYDIKAGSHIIINAFTIGRDPILWEKPEEFNPERFLNSSIDYKGHDFHFIPFGVGRRICPGITFAMSINEIALANLVHKFNWSLPGEIRGEDLDMTESTGMTIRRKFPLMALATPHPYYI